MTCYLIIIIYLWIIIESMVRRLQKFVGGYDGFISPKIRTNFLCRNAEFSSFPLTPFTDISRGGVLAFFLSAISFIMPSSKTVALKKDHAISIKFNQMKVKRKFNLIFHLSLSHSLTHSLKSQSQTTLFFSSY